MRSELEKWRSKNSFEENPEQRALRQQFYSDWTEVLPLRRMVESKVSGAVNRARKVAAQEAVNVVRDSMNTKWGLLLFSASASGRKIDRMQKVLATEPRGERLEDRKKPEYASHYYTDKQLVAKCAAIE